MDNKELFLYLKLYNTPNVGNKIALKLLKHFGAIEAVFSASEKQIKAIHNVGDNVYKSLKADLSQISKEYLNKEMDYIARNNVRVVSILDMNYPKNLKHCNDAPFLLFIKGNVNFNNPKIISVIGTRNLTKHGAHFCSELFAKIAVYNPIIVSGLAYGTDILAHQLALEHNLQTIAVLPNGLKNIYPKEHEKFCDAICENGGLMTEFWSSKFSDKENFVKRNRIVAGLSIATVLIESAVKGGSLITTSYANDYNRDVFALPGRVTDKYSMGCNDLIKQHQATLITCPEDLIKGLSWDVSTKKSASIQTKLFVDLTDDERKIVTFLEKNAKSLSDDLMVACNLPLSEINTVLLHLELKGMIKKLPGKYYELI